MNSYRLAVCSIQNYDPLHESPVKPQLYNAPHESPVEPLQSEEVPESWAKWCRKRINAYTHRFPLYTSGGINDARSQSTCLKIEVEGLAECGGMCDIYRGTAILNDGSKVKVRWDILGKAHLHLCGYRWPPKSFDKVQTSHRKTKTPLNVCVSRWSEFTKMWSLY